MNPNDVADYLKANCPLLKTTGGVADFAQAEKKLKGTNKLPALFVIPLAENASRNTSATMVVQQEVSQMFGLLIACSNVRDATGTEALNDLYQVRQQIISEMLGWIPPGQKDAFEFSGGNLHDMSDQVVWWQDNWTITIYLRSA